MEPADALAKVEGHMRLVEIPEAQGSVGEVGPAMALQLDDRSLKASDASELLGAHADVPLEHATKVLTSPA